MTVIFLIFIAIFFALIEHAEENKGLILKPRINKNSWNLGVVLDVMKAIFFIVVILVLLEHGTKLTYLFITLHEFSNEFRY